MTVAPSPVTAGGLDAIQRVEPALRSPRSTVAVAGASGYVGRLLAERLSHQGYDVVALGRDPSCLPTGPAVRAIGVDVGDVEITAAALADVGAAFYLVHALAGGDGFADRDKRQAGTFAEAARRAGVERIVYLGALGHDDLSPHLASRQEVGAVLRSSGIPVVELRAAVILGARSISFEMLRSLTERLPVMVCPRWVGTRLQPLAERDLLAYLEESLTVPPGIYEIGTPDVTDYGEMMRLYAQARGLRPRHILTIPLLTPSLSARWVDLVSPVDRRVSHSLIESLVNEVVVHEPALTASVFTVRPASVTEAIVLALDEESARVSEDLFDRPEGLSGGVFVMRCEKPLPASLLDVARLSLDTVGGDLGWYGMAWVWRVRMMLGRLGGERISLRRAARIEPGATVDWWTVTVADEHRLVLHATDWFCGEGWLGYRITPSPPRLEQVAAFRPKGLIGLLYWRMLRPVHWVVFRAMARRRVRRSATTPSLAVGRPRTVRWRSWRGGRGS